MKKLLLLAALILLLVGFAWISPSAKNILTGLMRGGSPVPDTPQSSDTLSQFSLPPGFSARLFASGLPGARVLARDPRGVFLVSLSDKGKVVVLPDTTGDGIPDEPVTLLEGLNNPHGLAFDCPDGEACTLYVAETNALSSYDYDALARTVTNRAKLANLPTKGGGHSTRSLLLHPDGTKLLVSVGSSCNVCRENDPRRASVLSFDLNTKTLSGYANGLRNTVFMETHYVTGDVWGTDMGRDLLGDDIPPDEMNIIREGKNYGWPNCYGKNIHDDEFDTNTYIRAPCTEPYETPSHIDIPAHSAPLGFAFVPEEGWPEKYWYDALVAYHGSWNRSIPTGYKIVRIPLDALGNPEGPAEDFMTGFMQSDGKVIGRPVSVVLEPGGVMFVSDDKAGAVYKVVYDGRGL